MGVICSSCGRDIDALGQGNMGLHEPLAVRDELDRLRRENEMLRSAVE